MTIVTIFGYGSLMDPASAVKTMPQATNFRPAILNDYSRVFSLVSISGIRYGQSNLETKEMAALAIRPNEGEQVMGCLFDIPEDQLVGYFEREHRYRSEKVIAYEYAHSSIGAGIECWTVVEQTNEDYQSKVGSQDNWDRIIGQYYTGLLWGREDILPVRGYLIDCFHAAKAIGGDIWLQNFLDDCLLADGFTSVRQYLIEHPDWFSGTISRTVM